MWPSSAQDMKNQIMIILVFYHVSPGELRWTRGRDGGYGSPEHPRVYWDAEVPGKHCHKRNLETLPHGFFDMHALKPVKLNYCENMKLLPESVGNLTSFQSTDLCMCF